MFEDPKVRAQFYELLQFFGDDVGATVAARVPDATPAVQRELLVLLGRLGAMPAGFSARDYLANGDALVRREAVRLSLRHDDTREPAILSALADADDRVVFTGLTAAQEKCPPAGFGVIKRRIDRGELDSQLRTMGIRIVAQQHTSATLAWLLRMVVARARWPRRSRLRPATPEMLAALTMIATGWPDDPDSEAALKLAGQSKDAGVKAKIPRSLGAASQKATEQ
jgi:hypothetical protein